MEEKVLLRGSPAEIDLGGGAAFEPIALMGAMMIVPSHKKLQIVVQIFKRGIDLLAKGRDVEFVEEGLMEPFAGAIRPSMPGTNKA